MNFLLLGPLSVRLNAREVHVSAPRQRVVMAALLLNANRVISVDRITEYVWDGAPPPSAAATVRTYVMRLRQSLGEHASARILTRAPGYLLELGEHESDLGQFTAHRRRAAELAERGDLEGSSAALAEALALWREEPLADIPSRTLRDVEGRYLQELRLQTMELRFDAELALLRHAEIVPELVRLVREHPLREALVGKLMLALFRSGRQSEALDLYRRTRVLLVEQLGAEPGADLREVHRHILSAHDRPRTPDPQERPAPVPETAAAPAPTTVRDRSWPDPAQLPSVPLPLSARSDALARVRHFLTTGTMPAGMVATAVVTGRGGVGKSALALHAAHTMRGSSVHGQLYADLGGAERPLTAREVLPRFLADLGVPRDEIPGEESERESLYRSLTAGRRLLVVLDNASGSAQVRPLIPGSGGSRLLVTSRRRLADLEGARTLLLGPLDEAGSLELLGSIVGTARVGGEPRAARTVVTVCAGLPLAIRIAGTRLLERPHWSIGHLARRLTEAPRLLDELCAGDAGVRPCLDAEVAGLRRSAPGGIDPAEVLAALGAAGASSVSGGEVAVMFGCPEAQAEEALDSLVAANLLGAPTGGRYRLDALLRAYARERAQAVAVRRHGRSYMRAG
ncbi:winged helix-turn-helix domain-containing protein [Streptomyces sp. CYG20]|nr:winged helix-turn-helix domain-containing protein [Streptomyces sp. COG21]MBT3081677.1 winged helix-turn-helix domain-containing protein [Streptomyces sp. COG20]MBT3085151.1 winged helix-turn-helix domain-containing protein [Streptomyces sp. CYG21]MBT3096959.1 winged helix-turn-helix domain-containing protein [Streptomyces sp. CBG30]MBT3105605.1 winged helix-turn-helix domain-containing protein [Streptomyces sp. COG19]MBT3114000.1 winged helix-turn-helix domain-containing protein [Streptomy